MPEQLPSRNSLPSIVSPSRSVSQITPRRTHSSLVLPAIDQERHTCIRKPEVPKQIMPELTQYQLDQQELRKQQRKEEGYLRNYANNVGGEIIVFRNHKYITDELLQEILENRHNSVTEIILQNCPKLTDKCIEHISKCTALKDINVNLSFGITDKALRTLHPEIYIIDAAGKYLDRTVIVQPPSSERPLSYNHERLKKFQQRLESIRPDITDGNSTPPSFVSSTTTLPRGQQALNIVRAPSAIARS
jgi:hypothetical protein